MRAESVCARRSGVETVGEMSLEEKRAAVDKSTTNWWREYAARKNDEDVEHVETDRTERRAELFPGDVLQVTTEL